MLIGLRTGAIVAFALLCLSACGGEKADPREARPTSTAAGHQSTGGPHPIAGNFKPDGTRFEDCEGDWACLEQAFGNLAYRDGPKPTIRLFDRLVTTDDAVEGNCHRIVHMIGSASLARYDGNVAKAFAEGSASCWSG